MSETAEAGTPAPEPANTPVAEGAAEAEAPAPAEAAKPEREPWFVKRIAEQTRRIGDLTRGLTLAEQQLAKLNGGEKQDEAPDVNTLAERRAAEMVAQQQFNRDCDAVYQAGLKAHPDWDASLTSLGAVGALTTPMIEAAMETGDAHKVLYQLGKMPDEAMRIMNLSPARMGAALAKLAAAPAPAVQVSKAPPPARTISGGAARGEKSPDEMTMAEYSAWRSKQEAARA